MVARPQIDRAVESDPSTVKSQGADAVRRGTSWLIAPRRFRVRFAKVRIMWLQNVPPRKNLRPMAYKVGYAHDDLYLMVQFRSMWKKDNTS
jgi:hypothetical protein